MYTDNQRRQRTHPVSQADRSGDGKFVKEKHDNRAERTLSGQGKQL